ncbi:hypothetical protein [Amycolatopsis palatopharyngis]|uniref:hypothetical protein n=1 Tax=Amycolatopsis palatopharyngis TaxID=187982 RepID=UPI000E255187|nr:hypothetical protein [Amycolatopsis palatopharyngis]
MALIEGQVSVRDLVMGRGTQYKVLEFNPWARTARADQAGARAWNHGSWSGVEWATEVAVPLRVQVLGTDAASWMALHQDLSAAFRPVGESTLDVELRWMLGGVEYVMFGRPRMVEPEASMLGTGLVYTKAAFVALDPFIYAGAETVVTALGLPTFTGGLTIPPAATLNTNDGFEVDTAGWFASGGTLARSTAQAMEGAASGLATPDGVAATGVYGISSADAPAVTEGRSYRWTAWVYSPNGWSAMRPVIRWLDGTGTQVTQVEGADVDVPAGVWTRLRLSATAPAGAVSASGRVWQRLTPTAADVFYIDGARFVDDAAAGLTVPFTVDGVAADGFVVITNSGKAETGLFLRIDGPVPSPSVTLVRADGSFQRLTFDLELTTGQWLDVDTANRVVLLNGTTSRRGQTSGDWPILPPGTHTLQWSSPNYNDVATLSGSFRSAWH